MKSTISLVALILAGALPMTSTAAEPAKSPPATLEASPVDAGRTEVPPMFKELDQDKDGQVSKDEAKRSAEILARFDTLDSDRNGKVSIVEWAAVERPKSGTKP
ncbi:hypothetical protein [Aromatoleum diolicum]|uniref:EF-hand domain-containing protein n=1 Tax=Aromatoleum diolicum TaxID=75796 RepID=A0ABX1Q8J0_9RHOO|nr:hypothetical protein [Aromatoleum diolicum]NMG74678.1 hypothetical protein [Aromatoleum diolicum]